MSPIPKPERKPTPVEKAVAEILRQVEKGAMPMPKAVLVHPSAVTEKEGPLMKAYREAQATYGLQVSGISWDEQHRMDKTQLERDLEDSLWALAEATVPATPKEIEFHLQHLAGSETRIKRVYSDTVLILCLCKTVLRFGRCVRVPHGGSRCDEEVPVVEAGHALCVLHRASNDEWLPGSRFYRCDWGVRETRCTRVATMVDAQGQHWCGQEGHHA